MIGVIPNLANSAVSQTVRVGESTATGLIGLVGLMVNSDPCSCG